MKNIHWGMGACVAALALALTSGVASAQQKAPDAPAKADVKKSEPPKADLKKAEPKAPAKKAEKKAPSACAGIEEAACLTNNECMWVKEVVTKAGQKRKAHCQKKPTPPASKKVDAKKAEPAKMSPAPAPTAPAPAAPAPAKKN